MKKRNRITVCLVAGVLILAVSAGAAFGSVNGYSTYKEAVKALALKTDNVTMQGSMKATLDGKEFVSMTGELAIDGKNKSSHVITSEFGGQKEERYDTTLGNTETWFNADSKYYSQYTFQTDDTTEKTSGLLGISTDDEMTNRMVNFMEIAADTVMGDLKNNFVQLGKDGDKTQYQIEISKDQVPSLVNAGLSLFAYSVAADEGSDWGVYYEDYRASMLNAYEKLSGNKLSEEFRNGYLRQDDTADRRRTHLQCTPKADPLIAMGRARQHQFAAATMQGLSEETRRQLRAAMAIITQNLEAIRKNGLPAQAEPRSEEHP